MTSSDRNVIDRRWAEHYAETSAKRRARGWHRRQDGTPSAVDWRPRVWIGVGILFVVVCVVAVVLPK